MNLDDVIIVTILTGVIADMVESDVADVERTVAKDLKGRHKK